jgi:hypothetical protein
LDGPGLDWSNAGLVESLVIDRHHDFGHDTPPTTRHPPPATLYMLPIKHCSPHATCLTPPVALRLQRSKFLVEHPGARSISPSQDPKSW